MNNSRISWFNFGLLGYPEWIPVCQIEMSLMLAGAEQIIDTHTHDSCVRLIQIKKKQLISAALRAELDDDWILDALLVTALCGLLGFEIPQVNFDYD